MIQVTVGYSDGFGREIESKLVLEGGKAILRDSSGNLQRNDNNKPVRAQVAVRWLVSGHTVYNNKGKPAKQYLPYFSNTAHYEKQGEIITGKLVPPPTVIYYDPLLREIKVETPKGFCLQEKTASSEIPFSEKRYEIAQSGQIVNSNYNISGQLLVTSRQFTVGYKDYVNWGTTVELEKDNNGNPKLYVTQYSFNALQQLISETTPDDSVTSNGYNREGLLDQVSVKFKDGTVQNVISHITYDANRQRTKV